MKNTISVEFLEDRVFFIHGKRTFATSKQMRNDDGEFMPRRRYNLPLDFYKEFVKKKLIKKIVPDPTKKK